MTQPSPDPRMAIYSDLMWPKWNPRSESHGTSQEQADKLLDAYRAATLREAADELEKTCGESWASRQLRYMAKTVERQATGADSGEGEW
ncbi:hypothetical protein ACI2LJ_27675 [Streptomyces sp. NPDC088090]|uniref:hypothetical protein n=1 Tax=Streptomyces sp. NPDC088090 TaxID=3365822 RepID=UPI0038511578